MQAECWILNCNLENLKAAVMKEHQMRQRPCEDTVWFAHTRADLLSEKAKPHSNSSGKGWAWDTIHGSENKRQRTRDGRGAAFLQQNTSGRCDILKEQQMVTQWWLLCKGFEKFNHWAGVHGRVRGQCSMTFCVRIHWNTFPHCAVAFKPASVLEHNTNAEQRADSLL